MKNLFTAFLLFLLFSSMTIIQAQTPVTPTDAATGVSQATTDVSWTDFNDANIAVPDYDVELSTTGAFGGEETALVVTGTSAALPALLYNSTYYWRVRDTDTDGGGSDGAWSATYTFTTEIATAVITAPTLAATGVSVTPTINWTFADGTTGVTFDLEIDNDPGFGSVEYSSLGLSGALTSHLVGAALDYNTQYYVRITAKKAGEADKVSTSVNFTTEIATPVITAPTAAQVGVSVTPTISWTFAGGTSGVTFKIRTATDAGITTNVVSHTTTATGTSFAITAALNYNTSYWVEVTAQKALEADKVVVIGGSFKTAYATPTQVSPVDEAKDVNIAYNVDFTYTAVEPAYEIEISANSAFTAATSYDAGSTGTVSLDLSTLSYYTTYYWRIRALDTYPIAGGNYSAWSTTRSFRTIDNYTASTPFPGDAATDIPNSNIQLIWQLLGRIDYASFQSPGFKIVYDTDAAFTSGDAFNPVVLTSGFISTVSTGMRSLGLSPGTQYFWKVITIKPSNEGENYQTTIKSPTALVIGTSYRIKVNTTGDFTNIGAAANTVGTIFIATGTTPTAWGDGELVVSGDVATSATWSFTTSGAVVKPTIAYPKDETTVYSPVPIFYWYTLGFNVVHEYEIEWTDDITGSPLSANGTAYAAIVTNANRGKKTGIQGLFAYPTPALAGGKHVYWHVRTIIGTTVSDWSDTEDFYTFDAVDAAIPVPAYPTGGVEVYSKFPVMYWTLSGPSQGLTFDIRYGTALTGSNVDMSNPGVTSWTVDNIAQLYATLYQGLVGGTTYYWQVRSYNGTSYSAWSDYAEFSIYDFTADLKPILSWPIGGNLVYLTDVNFAWHVEGPSLGLSYVLEYNTSNSFVGGQTTISGIPSNLHTVSLSAGQTYWWRVRVDNTENLTNWSDVESFEVISGNGANVPVLNWPVGGATVWATSQDLSWTLVGGGSYTFDIEVYTDAGLTTHFAGSPFINHASSPKNITGLTAGATYYWRVRIYDTVPGGPVTSGSWSNVEVFIAFAGLSPEAPPTLAAVPRLGSPIGGVEVSSASPTLSFFSPTYSEGQISYDLEYSRNSDFSNSVVKTDLATPNYITDGLTAGTYYWRVRGKDAEGTYSGYSDHGTFKVTGVTAVENEEGVPQNYELSQNYPNPFNPSTLIKFSMPEAGYVTLKIYNMLGQEIKTLVNEQINAGVNTVTWNGQDNFGHKVSSGAYIYQIVSGNFVQTRKMILLK